MNPIVERHVTRVKILLKYLGEDRISVIMSRDPGLRTYNVPLVAYSEKYGLTRHRSIGSLESGLPWESVTDPREAITACKKMEAILVPRARKKIERQLLDQMVDKKLREILSPV